MDRDAQVESLLATSAHIAVGKRAPHLVQQALMRADRLADQQRPRVFQRLANLLAAGHFTDTAAARAVAEDDEVAREERPVRAAQVQQHAVVSRNRDHAHLGEHGPHPS